MKRFNLLTVAPYILVMLLTACGSGSNSSPLNNSPNNANESGNNGNESGNNGNNNPESPTISYLYTPNADGTINSYALAESGESIVVINSSNTITANNSAINGNDMGSYNLVVDPSGRFAYVPNFSNKNLGQFAINAQSGSLSAVNAPLKTQKMPRYPVFSKSGACLFLSNFYPPSNITTYSINQISGILTQTSKIEGLDQPEKIVLSQDGHFAYLPIYGESSVINMYSVDESNCLLTPLNPASINTRVTNSSANPWVVTLSPNGNNLYATNLESSGDATGETSNIVQFSINTTTGQLAYLPESSVQLNGMSPGAVIFESTGKYAYVGMQSNHKLAMFSVDSIGQLQPLATPELRIGNGWEFYSPIMFNPKNNCFYIAYNNTIGVYSINTDGALSQTSITSLPDGVSSGYKYIGSMQFNASGTYLYVNNLWNDSVEIYTVNQTTGALTLVGPLNNLGHDPIDLTVYPTL